MREFCELRVDEEFAGLLFAPEEGERLGDSVRKVKLATTDFRFAEAGRLQAEMRRVHGRPFFYGWGISRRYTKRELNAAKLLHLIIWWRFEPTGEECGTEYDESAACPRCKAGARQTTDLFLRLSRLPKKKDAAVTIGGEIVVSRRLVDLFERHGLTGAEFGPVRSASGAKAPSEDWFQLLVTSSVDLDRKTRAGNDPFDYDEAGEYRCPHGDLVGLNILSEPWVSRDSYDGADIARTRQYIGVRRGLLRPEPLLVASPKLWRLIRDEKLKGFGFEVAHLV